MKAAFELANGLIDKKFAILGHLHNEYEMLLTAGNPVKRFDGLDPRFVKYPEYLKKELEKFRRAAPGWWADSLRERHQELRLDMVKNPDERCQCREVRHRLICGR
jgi:hypothetical protein